MVGTTIREEPAAPIIGADVRTFEVELILMLFYAWSWCDLKQIDFV
jgi:hypothetical protein